MWLPLRITSAPYERAAAVPLCCRQARNLDSAVSLTLWVVAIFALLIPFHLLYHWDRLTPSGLAREFLVKVGQIMGLLASITAVFYGAGLEWLAAQLQKR